MKFKIGTKVKLKESVTRGLVPSGREDNFEAVIERFLSDIDGGVYLSQDLNGLKYWNVSDLEVVK